MSDASKSPELLRLLAEQHGLAKALKLFPDGVKAAAERGLKPLGDLPQGQLRRSPRRRRSSIPRASSATNDRPRLSHRRRRRGAAARARSCRRWNGPARCSTASPRSIRHYNAFLAVTADKALAQAKAAEAEIAKGQWRGPMHGVPYAAKDIFDVEGMATTCHSKIRMDHRATADAFVIRKLREAGAVLLGKLALHEFATGGPAFDLPWPPARNPWNRDLHPGGSSSGSGAALAAGMAPAALGTDTGGSVRNPATCCGIVGMKPTYGAVSASPACSR